MSHRTVGMSVFLGAVLCSLTARADLALGAGVSGNFGLDNQVIRLPQSWSLDGLVGYRITFGIVELTPELDLTYLRSAGSLATHDIDWAFAVAAGGRLGVRLGFVVPSAYAHYGLGSVDVTSQSLSSNNKTGPYFEAGGALDFRLTDQISLGAQVGYGSLSLSNVEADIASASVNRLRAGVHLTLFL